MNLWQSDPLSGVENILWTRYISNAATLIPLQVAFEL